MSTQQFIDSLDFAARGKELRGEVAASEMSRLKDMLAGSAGKINYVLRGLLSRQGDPVLEVMLDGSCQFRCQRCLQEFPYPIKLLTRLKLVTQDKLDKFPVDADEIDCIPADKNMDVMALFEEELLLNLPFAPKHPEIACRPAMEEYLARAGGNEVTPPFAVLAGLKNDRVL